LYFLHTYHRMAATIIKASTATNRKKPILLPPFGVAPPLLFSSE